MELHAIKSTILKVDLFHMVTLGDYKRNSIKDRWIFQGANSTIYHGCALFLRGRSESRLSRGISIFRDMLFHLGNKS